MKKVAIILASGNGDRFGFEKPKQFYKVYNIPVLIYSIYNFYNNSNIDEIILVLNKEYYNYGVDLVNLYYGNLSGRIKFCVGGKTRQESLYKGVLFSGRDNKIIISHCCSRPIIPLKIIKENIELLEKGCCVNTVKNVYDTMIYNDIFIDRNKTFVGLTPQTFYSNDFIYSYSKNKYNDYTCACSLLVSAGFKMRMLKTDANIHKITTIEDIPIIESLVESSEEYQNLFRRT